MSDNKVFVIGIDGMDPKMTKRMIEEGKLPNIKKFVEMGSAREDLVLLGAVPTITPPMWTTLATGAYPSTHGITCYWNPHPTELDTMVYAFDSTQCKAEQVWNCIAEAGKKVLVWDWPGASWPPSSDNENLHVVAGLGPVAPNMANCKIDPEVITIASADIKAVSVHGQKAELHGGAGCVMEVETESSKNTDPEIPDLTGMSGDIKAWLCFDHMEGEECAEMPETVITYDSPLREPKNWGKEIPEGALEFPVVIEMGMRQLPALLLKNNEGVYDHVEIYMNKKDAEPWVAIEKDGFIPINVMDINKDGQKITGTRWVALMEINNEIPSVKVSLGDCLDITTSVKEDTWKPKSLYQQTVDIAGYCPTTAINGGGYPEMFSRRYLPSWNNMQKWYSKALLGLIEQNDYQAVFSHLHSIDHLGHACWRWAKSREKYGWNDEKVYQGFLEEIYLQADEYVASLMPLIDKGWTLILTSDHGLLCSEEDELPYLGEGFMMNVLIMEELGYTIMKKDENGNRLREIDWEKTRAVAPRGNHIYINLKGRNPYGIVEPEDKYELERQIIDDLYNYRENGKRIINLALRNKDAVLLGLSGERAGDIVYFLEEGFNRLHGDSLPTTEGYFGTSVSPIFAAVGKGVKAGYTLERQIREVDVAPTVAAILGVRQPAQADGAVVHQLLAE
ncbi:MAG: nucleotide pyrophosphatase [Peptococcaceae bacterium]|nr:nucleotide pyrophosphatase [Peptococcaceae bacterium]